MPQMDDDISKLDQWKLIEGNSSYFLLFLIIITIIIILDSFIFFGL